MNLFWISDFGLRIGDWGGRNYERESIFFRRYLEVILFVEFVAVFTVYWPRIARISTN